MERALTNIINSENLNDYPLFKDFCQYKEKGLRKQSLKSLNLFLQQALEWDIKKQQQFACWIFEVFEVSEDVHQVFIHPLEEKLLKPLMEEWMDLNPEDPRLYRWYGLFLNIDKRTTYLDKALKLGGDKEQLVLLKLIDIYIDSLWYSFHHISEDLYLGNIQEDRLLLKEIEQLSEKVEKEEYKINIYQLVSYYSNLMSDWISFSSEGTVGFVQWCEDKGKAYEFTKIYYYEK